jgi:hypothetical protein
MINEYRAYYSTTIDGTYTQLSNLVEFSINVGRRHQLDQYGSATATLTFRYPTGFASPITQLVAGTFIRITGTENFPKNFSGRISNVSVQYGMPYSGGVGNADYLLIECESWFASLGRMEGNDYAMPAGTVLSQVLNAFTPTGVSMTASAFSSEMAASTISSTWGDWLNRTAMSMNGRIIDAAQNGQIKVVSPFDLYQSPTVFTDEGPGDSKQVYNQIEFQSIADNFYTQVTVDPESFPAATVTKAGATTPYRTYETNTFNSSTAQATDLANYLLNNYGTSKLAISSISASQRSQGNYFLLDQIGIALGEGGVYACVGTQISIEFRGSTYVCVIEGCTVSGTPEDTIYTFHLSGADLNAYLILDNATFGKLNENKLGY